MSGPLYSLQDLADEVDGEILGDPSIKIDSICTIQNASKGCISFLANQKYKRFLSSTKASAVIVNQENAKDLKCAGIIVKDPYTAYAVLSSMFISKKNLGTNGKNNFKNLMRVYFKKKKFFKEKVNLFDDKFISYHIK